MYMPLRAFMCSCWHKQSQNSASLISAAVSAVLPVLLQFTHHHEDVWYVWSHSVLHCPAPL